MAACLRPQCKMFAQGYQEFAKPVYAKEKWGWIVAILKCIYKTATVLFEHVCVYVIIHKGSLSLCIL